MSNNKDIQPLSARGEWLRTEGFALYTDVNEQMLTAPEMQYTNAPITQSEASNSLPGFSPSDITTEEPSAVSLYLAMQHVSRPFVNARSLPRGMQRFNVSEQDRTDSEQFTFANGFGDLDFTWHFSAGVANATVDHFVDTGVITKEQKDQMVLADWANIIGTGWFSKLNHDLALTYNGMYGSFGKNIHNYKKDSFGNHLTINGVLPKNEPLFEYREELEPDDSLIYATVGLSRIVVRGLRQGMKSRRTPGCPVARKSVRFSPQQFAENPHVKSLLNAEVLQTVPERSDDDKVRVTQEMTAIDKSLAFFALQLDRYEAANGTPVLYNSGISHIFSHASKPPVDMLRWPAE